MTVWKQIRPDWCPYKDCNYLLSTQNKICKGKLLNPESHDGDVNTHRLCIDTRETSDGIFNLLINKSDIYNICRILQGGEYFDW